MDEDEVRGEALTEAALRDAIHALDGAALNDLYLEGPGEAHLAVAGGPAKFLVYATRDNDAFHTLTSDGSPEETLEIVGGGQLGIYPASHIVEREAAVAAALHWLRTGEPNPSQVWHVD